MFYRARVASTTELLFRDAVYELITVAAQLAAAARYTRVEMLKPSPARTPLEGVQACGEEEGIVETRKVGLSRRDRGKKKQGNVVQTSRTGLTPAASINNRLPAAQLQFVYAPTPLTLLAEC
ncbi:hypothetical protein NDU88_007502 [Pleurodeles waltl]|uniref:Uncharacterized protein n=1 Tax=Pleurodeles waltl TaxID=8319 RepID=A0AAV7LVK7_PLEWA|nr:hypothetical protein NDU88_007502 [Pleurodeles waltl]